MRQRNKVIWVVLMTCGALFFLSGCNTQKRDIKRLDAYFLQYREESARLSNLIYPCFKGEARSDTVIVRGKPDTVIEYDGIHVDSIRHDTVFATKTKIKAITNTITKMVHDTVVDYRQIAGLNEQIKSQRDSVVVYRTQLSDVKHGKSIWMWIAIGSSSLILIFIVAKIIIFFYGGAAGKVINKI